MNPGPNISSTQNTVPVLANTNASGIPVSYTANNQTLSLAALSTDLSGNMKVDPSKSGLLTNVIGYKPFGTSVQHNFTVGRTFHFKLAVPVPDFYSAQLVIYHGDTTASTGLTYQAILAATETADQTDQGSGGNKTYKPTVGGVQYTSLDDTIDAYGWRSVTWSGSATQAASAATSNDNPNIYVSDVCPVVSVARADSGETLPLIMGRLFVGGATGTADFITPANRNVTGCNGVSGSFQLTVTPSSGGSFLSANAGDYVTGTNVGTNAIVQSIDSASQITVTVANSGTVSAASLTFTSPIAIAAGGGNYNASVSTVQNGGLLAQGYWVLDASGLNVTAPASNNPSFQLNNTFPAIGLLLQTSKMGPTIIWFGDSTVQNSAISYGGFDSVGIKAVAALAKAGTPCGYVQHGRQSGTTAMFGLSVSNALAAWKPTGAIFQAWSHNNSSLISFGTAAGMNYWVGRLKGYAGAFRKLCKDNNVIAILSTGTPSSAVTTSANDLIRTSYLNSIRTEAGNIYCLDTSSAVTDGNSPERIQSNYDWGDSVHPNNAGLNAQALVLIAKIKSIFGI